MHSAKLVVLLAAVASAQSTSKATLININPLFFDLKTETLTVRGSASDATTYTNNCKETAIGSATGSAPASTTNQASVSNIQLTPIPRPTGSLARRQSDTTSMKSCEPYTVIQGPETFQFQMTDSTPGMWAINNKCNWKGDFQKADVTCSLFQSGSFAKYFTMETDIKTTVKGSEFVSAIPFATVAIVTGSGSSSGTPTPANNNGVPTPATTSGAPPAGSGTSATGARTSSSASPSAFAAARPLPTGAMAFVGGAAGIFAAALAL